MTRDLAIKIAVDVGTDARVRRLLTTFTDGEVMRRVAGQPLTTRREVDHVFLGADVGDIETTMDLVCPPR